MNDIRPENTSENSTWGTMTAQEVIEAILGVKKWYREQYAYTLTEAFRREQQEHINRIIFEETGLKPPITHENGHIPPSIPPENTP